MKPGGTRAGPAMMGSNFPAGQAPVLHNGTAATGVLEGRDLTEYLDFYNCQKNIRCSIGTRMTSMFSRISIDYILSIM